MPASRRRKSRSKAVSAKHATRRPALLDLCDDLLASILHKALTSDARCTSAAAAIAATTDMMSVCKRFQSALSLASQAHPAVAWLRGQKPLRARDCSVLGHVALTGKWTGPFWATAGTRSLRATRDLPLCDFPRLAGVTRLTAVCTQAGAHFIKQLTGLCAALPQLRTLELGLQAADVSVPHLSKLTALHRLELLRCGSPKAFDLPPLLQTLVCSGCIPKVGLRCLEAAPPGLVHLELNGRLTCDFRGALLRLARRTTALQTLSLDRCCFLEQTRDPTPPTPTDRSAFTALQHLEIEDADLLPALSAYKLPNLRRLRLLRRHYFENLCVCMASAAWWSQLTRLDLPRTVLTEEVIDHLSELPALRVLAFPPRQGEAGAILGGALELQLSIRLKRHVEIRCRAWDLVTWNQSNSWIRAPV